MTSLDCSILVARKRIGDFERVHGYAHPFSGEVISRWAALHQDLDLLLARRDSLRERETNVL